MNGDYYEEREPPPRPVRVVGSGIGLGPGLLLVVGLITLTVALFFSAVVNIGPVLAAGACYWGIVARIVQAGRK